MAWCKADPLFLVNAFIFTVDPRRPEGLRAIPFCTWPSQDEVMMEICHAIATGQDRIIEKSRDKGVTYLVLVAFLAFFQFIPESSFLVMSRNEEYVEKQGDPKCLFWKIESMLANEPKWLQPPIVNTHLHLGNVANGSVIDGEATTEHSGRGDRRLAVLVDEAAAIRCPELIEAATADVTRCRLRVSTPQGMNLFGRLRHSGKIKVVTVHWRNNPNKNSGLYTTKAGRPEILDPHPPATAVTELRAGEPKTVRFPSEYPFVLDNRLRSPWYDAEERRRASRQEMAQEVDIDYLQSGTMFFDSARLAAIQAGDVRPPVVRGRLDFVITPDHRISEVRFLEDPGGPLALWFWPDPLTGAPPSGMNYVAGFDIGLGMGASNSVGEVLAVDTGEQVAELADPNLSPEAFARYAVALSHWFAGASARAYMIWERNGPGGIFGKEVHALGEGYYYREADEAQSPPTAKKKGKPGWWSDRVSKHLLLGDLRRGMGISRILIRSEALVDELRQYVFDEQGNVIAEVQRDLTTGAREAHGDRVIAAGVAHRGLSEQPKAPPPVKRAPAGSYIQRRREYEATQQSGEFYYG